MPHRLLVILLGLAAVLVCVTPATGQDEDRLRDRIDTGKQRERSLGSAAARLGRLERQAGREVAVLAQRIAQVEGDLAASRDRLARTELQLAEQRERLRRTRRRLEEARTKLATILAGRYTMNPPDVVGVVLAAGSFADLLSRMEFLRRVAESDATIVRDIRRARDDAKYRTQLLRPLVDRRRTATDAVARQRDALAGIGAALAQRQATLQRARDARLAAARATRRGRAGAQRALDELLEERERAARAVGPGGPWAIPWPIVECESGGQNLPPNFASASGYYQFITSTWKGMGGSTTHAYQASKAEQDRLAAKLWDGGRGARNWDCAVIVGLL